MTDALSATPSVRTQLEAMDLPAAPYPGTPWPQRRREPIGTARRAAARREESFYAAFSERCRLKRCDLWHTYTAAYDSEAGWPDFVVLGIGWLSFVELKATSINTGLAGKLSKKQERWRDAIEAAGAEYKVFVLPDDWQLVDEWLGSKP